MSALSDWNDIIRRTHEERQREENELLAKMEAAFPAQVLKLREMPHSELLDAFRAYSGTFRADPRQWAVFSRLADEARAEILDRLNAPHLSPLYLRKER